MNDPKYNNIPWRKASKGYRKKNIFCEVWLTLGRSEKSEVTDHIIPVLEGGAFWDRRNWMAMSHFWHNRKRRLENNKLKLKATEGKDGDVPEDRQEIIKLLIEKYGDDERVTKDFNTNPDGTAYHLYDI